MSVSNSVTRIAMCRKVNNLLTAAFVLFSLKMLWAQREKCAELEIYSTSADSIFISENDFINLSFGTNVSACKQLDVVFKIIVKTNTSAGIIEEDGRVELTKDRCSVTSVQHVTCTGHNGVAELYRQVNTSHVAIELTMWWKEDIRYKLQRKKLQLHVSRSSTDSFPTDEISPVGDIPLTKRGNQTINTAQDFNELVQQKGERLTNRCYILRVHTCGQRVKEDLEVVQCRGQTIHEGQHCLVFVTLDTQGVDMAQFSLVTRDSADLCKVWKNRPDTLRLEWFRHYDYKS